MDPLAGSAEDYHREAVWVSQLEAVAGSLEDAGRSLRDELRGAEDKRDRAAYDRAVQRLGAVGVLRADIAWLLELVQAAGDTPARRMACVRGADQQGGLLARRCDQGRLMERAKAPSK